MFFFLKLKVVIKTFFQVELYVGGFFGRTLSLNTKNCVIYSCMSSEYLLNYRATKGYL